MNCINASSASPGPGERYFNSDYFIWNKNTNWLQLKYYSEEGEKRRGFSGSNFTFYYCY